MRVLVTGGAGFLGGHLVDALRASGDEPLVFDKRSGGDVRDPEACAAACRGVEAVIHAAAISRIPVAVREPELAAAVNVDGTRHVLEAAVGAGVRRVVLVSSSKVYGDAAQVPTPESAPHAPLEPYGASKAEAETILRGFDGAIETVILRPFTIYGPGMALRDGFLSEMLGALREGREAVVAARPRFERDMVYVDDVVAACLAALRRDEAKGGTFNAGTGRAVALEEIATALGRLAGETVAVRYEPPRPGTVRRACADLQQSAEKLEYRPSIGFLDGLERTWEWCAP